jgi:CRP/FNR family transcriptional regulator, cyclic AMP receptor protein
LLHSPLCPDAITLVGNRKAQEIAARGSTHRTATGADFFRANFPSTPRHFTLADETVDVDIELQEALRRIALFADFAAADFELLLTVAREVAFPEGARVVERGQPEAGLFVVVEGEVGVVVEDEELVVLPRGSFFGEISCLLGEPVVADVVARSSLRCLLIPPEAVEQFLLEHPRVTLRMLKTEARRLKSMDESRV